MARHSTYLCCLSCRVGHELVSTTVEGDRYVISGYTLETFSRLHVWRGHDVRCLPSEVARQVIGEPELFTRHEST